MKKLFALLAALAMLLSCAAAFADVAPDGEAPAEPVIATPLTIYSETDIDRDVLALDLAAMGLDEGAILKADTVAAVLTEATERLTLVDNGFQWDLMLGGKDILTVAGEFTDAGFVLGSNLFPNHVISISNEEMAGAASRYEDQNKALERIDINALARAVAPHFSNFIATFMAAFDAGETQQGDYTLNGIRYNTLVPIDVDVAALSSALTQLEKDLLADPTVAVTIAQFDRSGKHTKAVEKAIDPANAPALHLDVYATVDAEGNQSGPVNTAYTVTMPGKNEPAVKGDVVANGEDVTATAQFLTKEINMAMDSRKTETGHVYKGDLTINGLYFGCEAEVSENDGYYNDTGIYFLDPDHRLISQRSTMAHEGALTYDLSKGTPVTLADLTSKKSNALKALGTDAMIGTALITSAAGEALPEEVSAMLSLFSLSSKD